MDREAAAMTRRLRLLAPAKINWSLEALRIRPDGYHEIRSVLQTIDLCDIILIGDAEDISIEVTGEGGMLGDLPPAMNLAYRAAMSFRALMRANRGARIVLEKHIPVAAGLGGGSSDAAAVLRGLNVLWETRQPDANLVEIAGEIGSDPPFFIACGTAAVSSRGEQVHPLDDAVAPPLLLATPPPGERGEKTARMFGALTPDDFSEGDVTDGVRDAVQAGRALVDGELNNVFERVTSRLQPETEIAMDALRAEGLAPHLAGAGPSFFLFAPDDAARRAHVEVRLRALGFEPRAARLLPRESALAIEDA
jgi:4-diphosphocytidyl-2-C-methyl-D-erythritol kinase